MDGCWDVKLASPQNAAGAKINDVIAKHMLTSQYEFSIVRLFAVIILSVPCKSTQMWPFSFGMQDYMLL